MIHGRRAADVCRIDILIREESRVRHGTELPPSLQVSPTGLFMTMVPTSLSVLKLVSGLSTWWLAATNAEHVPQGFEVDSRTAV